jgi:hypothetical protein
MGNAWAEADMEALQESNRVLSQYKALWDEWMRKTDWVQDASSKGTLRTISLGLHRADALKQEFDHMNELLQRYEASETHYGVAHSLAGFRAGFESEHKRKPTEQEIWNHAIRSYRDLTENLKGRVATCR